MPQNLPVALTIAGYDPSGGAGITADLAVFAAHGLVGTSATTVLTAQSTRGVASTLAVEPGFVRETLSVLAADFVFAGIKVGALGSGEAARVVAEFLGGLPRETLRVLDPVMVSSSGEALFSQEDLAAMFEAIAQVDWITPNWGELEVLTGQPIRSLEEAERAAKELQQRFPGLGVVATGGELADVVDLVVLPDGEAAPLQGERVESQSTHGTGCAFSSALLCGLIQGRPPLKAARTAKAFVAEGIRRGPHVGAGKGPLDLFWPLRRQN